MQSSTGDMNLAFCTGCGHFFNETFDPSLADYNEDYENSLHFSPRFNEYAENLSDRLISTYELHGKDIIEIGCGKGDFLKSLCNKGQNRGVGFDRSYEADRSDDSLNDNITFINDFYNESYSQYPVDFICCRHVLEHIEKPTEFLRGMRKLIGDRKETVFYLEVPNALFTIESMGIWDLIYEHCSYFSRRSLATTLKNAGFDILALDESFDGQYLYAEVKAAGFSDTQVFEETQDINELMVHATAFNLKYQEKVKEWENRLKDTEDQKTVTWGGGSKGVTFLNVLGESASKIEYIVDLNPHKQGKFVPGTGQKVVLPEELIDYSPNQVIVMNELYRDEIASLLKKMHIDAKIECV
jgi:cyclopropane fatty-acyl-phospholipid synthase-like methyltransferase